MRPLDGLPSIKLKLGIVIVGAVVVAVGSLAIADRRELPLTVSAPFAAVLALGMVQVLAHGMTSPLREMSRAAARMTKGDYSQRITASSRDEVGELARAFNTMAAELAENDRLRRDLIANVSHELRTPLAALRAVLENLVDGVQDTDRATLTTMLRQVTRLSDLSAQLLDLSRLESGAVPLDRRSIAVAELLSQAVDEARLGAPTAVLSLDTGPPGLTVFGDAARLHQVIANLLDNALRLSPGMVAVRAERCDGRVHIEVCDEGPGLPPGEETLVFERFYRADHARASSGGAGLGLAIVRWIVELHGGDVRAERRSPTGCRMVVMIPEGST